MCVLLCVFFISCFFVLILVVLRFVFVGRMMV